jgi:outer membrane protein OmpA-like peptidoglycan-associated protein
VEAQLISMGIDASRLTTKGFGDTKPISSNDTQDGKANNRRVEFVRM